MNRGVVVHKTKEAFQAQYGTLRNAALVYLEGQMPDEQASAFENVVAPEFLSAIANMALMTQLVHKS